MVTLSLPFPPSTNNLWVGARGRVRLTDTYRQWKIDAEDAVRQQKIGSGEPIKGKFTYHIVLAESDRKAKNGHWRDGDNFLKAPLDLLQKCGLIENDCLADAGSWSWGPLDPGTCFLRVYPKVSK
jgi:crossover junction endodeoxyribonuclease RusA